MVRQHKRLARRSIGWLIVYIIAALYLIVFALPNVGVSFGIWLTAIAVIVLIGLLLLIRECVKGTYNKVFFDDDGVTVFFIKERQKVLWDEVTDIRLLSEEMDVDNGLNERYYGIYYERNGVNSVVKVSYSQQTDAVIRKHYRKPRM